MNGNRIILVLLVFNLCACAVPVAPNPSSINEGLKLVDQGTLQLRKGAFDQAQASFEMAWEIANLAAALDGLGCVAFLREDYPGAEQYFVQAYQQDPDYSNSLGNLALLYERHGLSDEAQQLYERAIAEDPKNVRSRNNFAGFLVSEGGANRSAQGRKAGIIRAKHELHRAAALANNPIINENIGRLNGVVTEEE